MLMKLLKTQMRLKLKLVDCLWVCWTVKLRNMSTVPASMMYAKSSHRPGGRQRQGHGACAEAGALIFELPMELLDASGTC